MTHNTLHDIDLADKRVLLRAGFDLPIKDGTVTDETRIDAMIPTIQHILDAGASVILMAHQGRPKGERVPEMSQQPLVPVLEAKLGISVQFVDDCSGEAVQAAADALQPGQVLLLENLRYDKREKSKDAAERDELGKQLAALADVYVNDAFTNCHRDHASMTSVPKYLPSCMGLQLAKEVEHLGAVLDVPKEPVVLVIAGAKMETKVPVIEQYLSKGDHVLLGGCIANTFMAAKGYDIAESRYEEEWIETAQNIMLMGDTDENATVHVPTDVVVASEPSADAESLDLPLEDIEGDMKIFDVGSVSVRAYQEVLANAGTIIWNGPLGFYEIEQFAGASKELAKVVAAASSNGATSILGGGDVIDLHERYSLPMDGYTFVSTGGGAMLEFIAGKELPALKALEN